MRKARKLALTIMSVLFALTFVLGLAACGGQSAKDAIDAYLLPQDNQLVDADFTLPKKIGIDNGVNVEWKSDNAAIAIEDGGEEAETYTAKVTLQDEVTPVKLTVSSGGASKDFNVRVDELTVFTFMRHYANDDYDADKLPQRKTAQKEDFKLDTTYTIQDKTATIAWSVKSDVDQNYLTVEEREDGTWAHVMPGDDVYPVKLTAKFTYNDKSIENDYEISVSPDLHHRQNVYKMYSEAGFPIEFEGYVVHVYVAEVSEKYGPMATFYAVDSDFCSGYYIWQAALESEADVAKVVPGAHFTFSGDYAKNYNGLWETNGYEAGTAVFDGATPIDINDHIRAFDLDLITGVQSATWQMSRLVSLSGWEVSAAWNSANSNLTLKNGDKTIGVYTSTYVTTDKDAMTELQTKLGSLKEGDKVNIKGILGYNNGFRLQPRTAADIETAQATADYSADAAKITAGIKAVDDAIKASGFNALVKTEKEATMPTSVDGQEGLTISYKLAKKNIEGSPVTVDEATGKITVTPQDLDKTCLIEVTYTVGQYSAVSVFEIRAWDATDQDIVDEVAKALNKLRIDAITHAGEFDLPKVEKIGDETIEWTIGDATHEAPAWAHISGAKLVIDYLPDEAASLRVYAKVKLNAAQSEEVFFNVKVSAAPTVTFKALDTLEAGDYIYAAMHKGERLYAASLELDGSYIATTSDITAAVKFTVEKKADSEDWYIKMGAKYLEVNPYKNKDKVSYNLRLVDEPTEGAVWVWDDEIKILKQKPIATEDLGTLKPDDAYYYVGLRDDSDYTTMSPSHIKYITDYDDNNKNASKLDVTQHPARFGTAVEATDTSRAAEVLGKLTLSQTTFNETNTTGIALPTSAQYKATVVWALKGTSDYVTVTDNVLKINSLPAADTEVTLTVTVTVGEVTTEAKEVVITLKPATTLTGAGTLDDPYTVADALELGSLIANSGDYYTQNGSPAKIYVKGYITDKGSVYAAKDIMSSVLIADEKGGTPTLKLYSIKWNTIVTKPADGKTPLNAGDYIVIYGYLKLFNTELEIDTSNDDTPEIVVWTPDTSAPAEEKVFKPIETPTEGTYYYAMQVDGEYYYITGAMASTYYFGVTQSIENAKQVTLAGNNEDGWTIKEGDRFIEMSISGNYINAVYNDTQSAGKTWTWNSTEKVFVWTDGSESYIIGNTGTYTNIGGIKLSQKSGNHFAVLGTLETANDQDKAQAVLDSIELTTTAFYAVDTEGITLPAPTTDGAVVEWTIDGGTNEYVSIAGGKLCINKLPDSGKQEITLNVKVTVGGGTVNKDIKITVEKDDTAYGTKDAPISVSAALTIAQTQCVTNGDWTRQIVYMKGVAKNTPTEKSDSTGTYYQELYLVDETDTAKEILAYKISLATDVAAPAQNDVLVISGYITRFKYNSNTGTDGVIEFSTKDGTYVTALSNTRGQSTITLEAEGATVTGITNNEKVTNGTEKTFTVQVTEGKQLVSVTANDEALTAKEGNSYTITVLGDVAVKVTTINEGETVPETVTIEYKGGPNPEDTKNMTGDNDANTIFGLNASIFTITSTKKEGYANHVGLNKAGDIRLYASENTSLNISVASGYTIVSIKVNIKSGSADNLKVVAGTQTLTVADGEYAVNGASVVLSNTGTSAMQLYSIIVTYKAVTA